MTGFSSLTIAASAHAAAVKREKAHKVTSAPEVKGGGGKSKHVIKPGAGIYWGAAIGPQLTGGFAPWNTATIPAFEKQVGKKLSIVNMGWPFATCNAANTACQQYRFPAAGTQLIRDAGAIPLVSFQTAPVSGISLNDPITLEDIIAGHWDTYLRAYAREAKAWGHPFFLRLDWEMNGNWFPWSPGIDGNTPGDYVQAWRHIHDIFTSEGVHNATWVWCPNVGYSKNVRALYPGNSYVDWTCLDGYNNGTALGGHFQSWNQLYRHNYDEITNSIAPHKPMIVAEFASSDAGGNKAAWIANALATVPKQYPKIRALVYYDLIDGLNWTLESGPGAIQAFSQGIANPSYVTNKFGGLGTSTITPPVS